MDDDDDETEKMNNIVATALNSQFKKKQYMLPVSSTHYNMAIAWRGLKRYFSKKALKVISPGILRDARIGKKLNTLVYENHVLRQMNNARPTQKKPLDEDDTDDEDDEEKTPPKRPLRFPMKRRPTNNK